MYIADVFHSLPSKIYRQKTTEDMTVTLDPIRSYAPSGIDVLIAGGGIAGLYFALECIRNGHTVTVLESRTTVDPAGKETVPPL
jgi:monoamine oxidase